MQRCAGPVHTVTGVVANRNFKDHEIMELALGVPYGNWNERLMRRLSELGLNRDE